MITQQNAQILSRTKQKQKEGNKIPRTANDAAFYGHNHDCRSNTETATRPDVGQLAGHRTGGAVEKGKAPGREEEEDDQTQGGRDSAWAG